MRFIDMSAVTIPTTWQQQARTNNFSPVWSYLKTTLESIVGKKCWYNESINDGSSNPVDHFRPKTAAVKVLTSKYAVLENAVWSQLFSQAQTGYPFLEFEASNYRYASGFANSAHMRESTDGITRGKWDFFPIRAGTSPATSIQNLSLEENALLDPCHDGDPELVEFNEFGGVDPSTSVLTHSWDYCRVKVSIEVYNLTYYVLANKRRESWETCERNINLMTLLYNKPNKSPEEQLSFDHLFADLIKSLSKKTEYSAVFIDCIKNFKTRKDSTVYKWLTDEIPTVLLKK
ncbi:hypothetical protein SAMN05216464_12733 [Mucilaginibacter pineti]|uniref:TIGR02646 family protein n=1 Tax=Mucilaginibacter pineti TaxID=1391627 RepID=A0A1G7NII7_9SPHI|nr:hypothetical protein [Mucilaginibacter pineti]SDF73888.1 hypothetical protein SAMN05216464_12733 [Mucilaginibacter pineti]